ncbi:MAG: rod shape-determining protein [Clostridiales bacterium]|nr:rod shape-determining protein [Clostridiales bacterium]
MAIIAPDLGIDLGTSNTLIYVRKKGIVIDEPTLLVISGSSKRSIKSIGQDARTLVGRTSGGDMAVRPLQDGTIKEYDMTESILRFFIRKAIGVSHLLKPRAFITVPCRISAVEKRVVKEAAVAAGIRRNAVHLIEKPFASAYGSGLPVFAPEGSMVVDIGGGTTEVAIISIGGIVTSKSIMNGGIKMDEAIMNYIKHDYNMLIGDRMAEDIKIDWGTALPPKDDRKVLVRGRDIITGLPQTAEITAAKIYEALHTPCKQILGAIREVLDKAPPELAGDILKKGIYIMGGGSLLYGIDRYLASELGLPVTLAKDPMMCAAMGVGHLAENVSLLPRIGRSTFMREEME